MVQPIGSTTSPSAISVGAQAGGLAAQLASYQRQLSDCVNCDSANTLEGKATIQALTGKIQEIKARIDELTVTRSDRQSAASTATSQGGDAAIDSLGSANNHLPSSVEKNTLSLEPAKTSGPNAAAIATVGSVIDTFA